MSPFEKLLLENKAWAREKVEGDPLYFKRLASIQTPEFLWIGCSDSRVPANEITGTEPGEIFVHRNIANLVVNTDVNLLAVLDYAVNILKVKHVIICGHYGCGGVKAAMTNTDYRAVLNMWLRNIKDVYRLHSNELEAISNEDLRADRLVELNVREQINNLVKTSIIQRAWKEDRRPILHGWVYGLANGILKPMMDVGPDDIGQLDNVYQYQNL
jgi:carbonic anhydrase